MYKNFFRCIKELQSKVCLLIYKSREAAYKKPVLMNNKKMKINIILPIIIASRLLKIILQAQN